MYEPDNPEAIKFQSLIDEKIDLGKYDYSFTKCDYSFTKFFEKRIVL